MRNSKSGWRSISRSKMPMYLKVCSKASSPLPSAPIVRLRAVTPEARMSEIAAALKGRLPSPSPPNASITIALSYPLHGTAGRAASFASGAPALAATRGTAAAAAARVER